eukprot:364759-Chlamydomonas_euryale.AAC.18
MVREDSDPVRAVKHRIPSSPVTAAPPNAHPDTPTSPLYPATTMTAAPPNAHPDTPASPLYPVTFRAPPLLLTGDYCIALDDDLVIDAAHLAADTSRFTAAHINHSRTRANVARFYTRRACTVSFFAARDIAAGEELLYDYGRQYWRGREHLELP